MTADWWAVRQIVLRSTGMLLPVAQRGVIPVPVEAWCLETHEHRGALPAETADVRARNPWRVGPMLTACWPSPSAGGPQPGNAC